jgi:hypothetical protein
MNMGTFPSPETSWPSDSLVHLNFKAKCHTIRENMAVESKDVLFHQPLPEANDGIRWIHVPENDLASVIVSHTRQGICW